MSIPQHPYRPLIEDVAAAYPPLDPDVLEAVVWVESNFSPKARSASDARGLTQVIYRHHERLVDETAEQHGVPPGADALYHPAVALDAGGRLLRWLYVDDDEGTRSWERAVRKYFSGSYDPPSGFVDGQGTSADQHIAKFRTALATVKAERQSVVQEAPMATQPAAIASYRPRVIDKYLHVTQDGYAGVTRSHARGWAGIRTIVVHVQEGSNRGSWQHFHVVRASSTVLIGKNGDIWNLVAENRAPWTNGDVNRPDQTAIAMMNRFGWDPNTYSLTIENEGYSGNLPYTDAQFKSNVWQIWTWLKAYPTIERVLILRHGQINSVDRPYCPERSPYPFMRSIFAALEGGTVPVTPGKPTDIYRDAWPVKSDAGVVWDGANDLTVTGGDGKPVVFYADKRDTVTVNVDALNCRQWASNTANLVRRPLSKGDTFAVLGWVEGEDVDGERRWWVTPYDTRIWAGGTAEKPRKTAPVPTTPDDGVSKPDWGNNRDAIPVVLNGNTYYPLEQHGDEPGQVVRFKADTNIRLWAATHQWSPVTRIAKQGEIVRVTHWVKGEPVDLPGFTTSENRDKWLVIAEGNDPIHKGGRIWAGLVEEVVDIDALTQAINEALGN